MIESIASGSKSKRPRKGAKTTDMVTDDEGNEVEHPSGDERVLRPRPEPRARYRGARPEETDAEGETDGENPLTPPAIQDVVTPNARPRPRVPYRKKPPSRSSVSSLTTSPEPLEHGVTSVDRLQTPVISRKRGHSEAEDEDEPVPSPVHDASQSGENAEPQSGAESAAVSPSPPGSQMTEANVMQIRRKRVRH